MKHGVAASCCGGGFALGGTGALHKTNDIMRMENNVDILKQHLKTSVRKLKLGRKWVFQVDNDPKHTSKVVATFLKDNNVKVLEWPSQSPGLNPIEHLWAELKKRVRARRPTNLTQFHQLCQEEWAKIHSWLCRPHHPLESTAVEGGAVAVPGGDTARQDALDYASVKVSGDFRSQAKCIQPPEVKYSCAFLTTLSV